VAAQDVNLNLIAPLLVWVMIGLLAYWARKSHRPTGRQWLLVYGLVGALMLVYVAWDYIRAAERARLETLDRSRARKKGAKTSGAPATEAAQPARARARKKGSRHR
jgi:uncharacterized membrane protein YeaQ/YmgE (transglycosylase-associated protein family)